PDSFNGDNSDPNNNFAVRITRLVPVSGSAATNISSGNTSFGVQIQDAGTNNNVIAGNFIGQDASGGGLGNNNAGVSVLTGAVGNSIRGNSFQANTGLAIDLNADGVTKNDSGDTDTGGNDLLNFPVVASSRLDGSGNLIVRGFSRPGAAIELYLADSANSFAEGQTVLT